MKKEIKRHNCSYARWRRNFIVDMYESIARGRHIWESQSDHGLQLHGEKGIRSEKGETSTASKKLKERTERKRV